MLRATLGPLVRPLLRGGDPGEAAAARYLKATGHRVLARNWRSPRDARDEADLVVATPDRGTVVLVEVKRAVGDWDPLERVDARKRAVLWRLLGDLAQLAQQPEDAWTDELSGGAAEPPEPDAHGGHAAREQPRPRRPREPLRWRDRRLVRALRNAHSLRTDLVGVRGDGSTATVMRHLTALHDRPIRRGEDAGGRWPPHAASTWAKPGTRAPPR